MKKITIAIITTVVVLFLLICCGKMYRGQYTGNWNFTVIRCYWMMGRPNKIDTIYYSGKISRGKTEHELCIECTKNFAIFASVDKNGELCNDNAHGHEYVEGKFEGKNKLYLKYGNGGNGGGTSYSIEGVKK